MLAWPPGPRGTDGLWAAHWYDQVWKSTGFGPPERASRAAGARGPSRRRRIMLPAGLPAIESRQAGCVRAEACRGYCRKTFEPSRPGSVDPDERSRRHRCCWGWLRIVGEAAYAGRIDHRELSVRRDLDLNGNIHRLTGGQIAQRAGDHAACTRCRQVRTVRSCMSRGSSSTISTPSARLGPALVTLQQELMRNARCRQSNSLHWRLSSAKSAAMTHWLVRPGSPTAELAAN